LPVNDAAISAVAENVFDNATDAALSATSAAASADLAADQVTLAADQVTLAETQADNAANSATDALDSKNAAAISAGDAAASATTAVSAPGTSATSTTSVVVGLGSKSLTIETGKLLTVGASVKIANTATPTIWMHGDVTSYNSGTGALVVNVTTINGAGTLAAWSVSLSGPAGVSTYPKRVVSNKTAAYSVVLADHASIICTTSGTGDITLPASVTATVGFYFTYVNETAAIRNIFRVGSDTFQGGESSASVPPKSSITISCTTASASGKWKVESVSATGSGSGSVSLNTGTSSGAGSIAIGANGAANASGIGSIAMGSSTASGANSIAVGGSVASQSGAVAIGSGAAATGVGAIALGNGTASGQDSTAFSGNTASGLRSFACGTFGLADFIGKHVQGAFSPRGGVAGYSQYARTVLSANATFLNTNYVLTADNSGVASTSNIINVPLSRLVTFTAIVSAGQVASSGSAAAGWEVKGVIRRGNSGNVAFVGTPTVTSLGGTVPTGWTLTATADVTNQGLALTFNMGATSMQNVFLSATVHAAEVAI
jgi:hypothetical protein